MRNLPVVYEDVTDRDDVAEPAYLDIVEGFEAIGYRQVARVLGRPSRGLDDFVRDYSEEHHASLRAGIPRPAVLLVSPDGLVLVQVAWFYDFPEVIASTRMADGSLIETQRRWDGVPPWPKRAERLRRKAKLEGEMRRNETRGRHLREVDGDDPAGLEAAHLAHVAAAGGAPVPAPSTRAEVLAEVEHRFTRAMAIADRFALVYKLSSSLFAVLIAVGMLAVIATQEGLVILVGVVLFTLVTPVVLPRLYWGLLYARWYRPAYRPHR